MAARDVAVPSRAPKGSFTEGPQRVHHSVRYNKHMGTPPHVEIERKFLVERAPGDLDAWRAEHIEQGYLAITPEVEVRVRRRAGKATLTIKSAPALVRVEEEIPIEPERFDSLWPLTEGRRVVKTRHVRDHDGVVLELDVYEGELAGLLTLEVEVASEDAAGAFTPPEWVGADVTGDARYANQALALHGIPPAA
jgi:CYTH domain-containing protein